MTFLKSISALMAALAITLVAQNTRAESVEVVGQAAIDGAPSEARERALKDALRQASLKGNSRVSGMQLMQHGELVQDEVEVTTLSNVRDVQVLWEDSADGIYQVGLSAEVSPQSMCPVHNQNYRKAIAIAGFGLARPQQAT